ncbi:MAG: hypothetical protein DMF22_05850 [Verrucomicrobia bacterium]|nr:MAG: hypothetical protein DMF22_05850 [Verrucomicrobiota bacterium]
MDRHLRRALIDQGLLDSFSYRRTAKTRPGYVFRRARVLWTCRFHWVTEPSLPLLRQLVKARCAIVALTLSMLLARSSHLHATSAGCAHSDFWSDLAVNAQDD